MTNCPFCMRIWHKQYDKTYQHTVISFEPLNPVTPGHRLFLPIEHVDWKTHHSPGSAAGSCVYQAEVYAKINGIKSFNIITSNGAPATQTVPHLHIHLVPRRENDGLYLPWTNQHG